ncbi:MAG: GtrA family protein [Clostridium sp.]|nr:GtrA family protein [Clostridium sp.]MCM1547189.1 GtrA family protein [Ruminococcus sp.]
MLKKLYHKYEEAIMYIFFGGCTTLVYYIARFGSRMLLGDLGFASMIATAIAQITAITFAFITNKKFVFKSKTENAGQLVKEAVSFYAGRGVTFLLDMLITFIFIEKYSGFFIGLFSLDSINYQSGFMSISLVNKLTGSPEKMNEFIWTMLSQVIILILNYFFSKLFVFRKKKGEK